MANRNRVPPPEEDPPRRPPRAARQVRGPGPAGSLGIPAGPQHDRRRRRPRRRPGRHRPGPDPVHRRARPRPRRHLRRHPLRALREAPRRPPRPAHRRRHRPSPAPPRAKTHLRQDASRTTIQAHRRSHLHHHDHAVKPPTMAANTLKLRAVVPEQDQSLSLRVAGDELQTAPDAAGLVYLGIFKAVALLAEILDGSVAPSALADIAPVLSRVPVTESTRDLWFGVYMRFAVLVSIARFN